MEEVEIAKERKRGIIHFKKEGFFIFAFQRVLIVQKTLQREAKVKREICKADYSANMQMPLTDVFARMTYGRKAQKKKYLRTARRWVDLMGNNYVFLSPGVETKFRILHAFDCPIEQISVARICDNSHISRPTFYAHFDSKYSVSFWLLDLAFSLYLAEIGRSLSWSDGVYGFFSFLYGERDSLRLAFAEAPSRKEVEPRLEQRKEVIRATLRDYKHVEVNDDLAFYIDHFVKVGNFMTTVWCLEDMPYDARSFSRYFTECMPNTLIKVMDKGVGQKKDNLPSEGTVIVR